MTNKMLLVSSTFLHDILNPVTGVRIILEQVMKGKYGNTLEEIKPFLEAILQTNNRVSRLVESENKSDIVSINPSAVRSLDLLQVLARLHFEYSALAKCSSLNLHLEAQTPLVHGAEVIADVICIERMLSNVIQNAIKYTETGEVYIRLVNEGDNLVVEIEDTGRGIEPKELPKIFLPYYRLHKKSRGCGLGLYVAMMVAKSHGLQIIVDSKVGKGTKFRIIFPYTDQLTYGLNDKIWRKQEGFRNECKQREIS
ncbi:sensor histidine kinase [Nostoc sp. CCY0012]|uniref:sensor histidine kinase n=1 Tax=Nostoc sp. CCY0012 TaxID=1056123 RepID=UPI0039C65D00